VALALAVRTGEPESGAGALADIRAHPGAAILEPTPLSAVAAEKLVRRSFPDADHAFCDACEQATAGNPFYLRQLLDAARSEGLDPSEAGAVRLLALGPISVSRSILSRLGRMSAACRSLAVAVAVGDHEAPLRRAAALAGLDRAAAREAADALSSADILAPGEPLAFAHPLGREAVYADVPGARRAALHREAARLLSEDGAVPEQVAAQLLEGAVGSDGWARDALREAAVRARARGAPAGAAPYLRRALEEGPVGEERGELLVLTGMVEAEAGENLGTERLAEAVTLIETPRRRALALFELALLLSYGGRYPHAAVAAESGRRELGDGDPALAEQLDALHAISRVYVDLTDAEATARSVRASLEAPRLEASPAGRAVLGNASIALAFAGERAAGIKPLAARALHRRAPVDDPFDIVAFQLAAFGILLAGDVDAAERASAAAVDMARRRGSMLELAATMHVRSMARYQAGRLVEALADAEGAVEAGRWGWGATLPMAHAQLVFALLERGEVERADGALELPGGEERWAANVSYGVYLIARAAVWNAQGRTDEALAQLLLAGRLAEAVNARHSAIAPWRPPAVAILLAKGERDAAAQLAGEDVERARAFGAPGPIGAALRTRGLAVGGAAGIELLRESERLLAPTAARLEHVRTLIELGAALRRANHRKDARNPLREGLDLARRGGALVLAQRAHVELRAAGARPRRLRLTGVESLTPSERRVAELAAGGLTNREVAQRLYLTKKTVETHLGHAYRKLGISAREELTAVLAGD
jgi:DNA-binding CsgD family transcriptional regulator